MKNFINNPKRLLIRILILFSPLFRDEKYLKLMFRLKTSYKLNFENPETYNEKLQWLKINYRLPIMTIMADKYEAKKYTASVLGEQYVIKNYGVWNKFDDIDFDKLPKKFVLKTTHDSGGVIICKDKSQLDLVKIKRKMDRHIRSNSYLITREWPYKNIKPRLIAEELLEDEEKGDIWDYKFYCFHGEPKIMYISMGRQDNHVPLYFYDMEFNLLDLSRPGHEILNSKVIVKPENWELMKNLARKSSKGLPHVRVDFYSINNRVLSGEYTFFQGGGMLPFIPLKWDYKMGEFLNLSII
jgi:hypothetical protein